MLTPTLGASQPSATPVSFAQPGNRVSYGLSLATRAVATARFPSDLRDFLAVVAVVPVVRGQFGAGRRVRGRYLPRQHRGDPRSMAGGDAQRGAYTKGGLSPCAGLHIS